MSEDDFRALCIRLAESYVIDPETADRLLREIIRILKESIGEEEKR